MIFVDLALLSPLAQGGVGQDQYRQPTAEVMCPVSSQQLAMPLPALDEPTAESGQLSRRTEGNSHATYSDHMTCYRPTYPRHIYAANTINMLQCSDLGIG